MNKKISKTKVFSLISVVLFLISAIIYLIAVLNSEFADYFNSNISSVFRFILANLTSWVPFSLGEYLILAIPLFIVILIIIICKSIKKGKEAIIKITALLLSVVLLFITVFVFVFGIGYRTTSLDKLLDLEYHDISVDDLYKTLEIVVDELNILAEKIDYRKGVGSVIPYDYGVLKDYLSESYDSLAKDYLFIKSFNVPVKQLVMSKYITYTHISGVYLYFTGEANINTNYPYYVNAFSTAHEMAHQRGISRENEANFIAYLTCIKSNDDFIRYSGYLEMYSYLSSALYSSSPSLYAQIYRKLNKFVVYDLKCYSDFFDKYRENKAADISDVVNDSYLTLQGTEGNKSYGLVVDLTVAYYLKNNSH